MTFDDIAKQIYSFASDGRINDIPMTYWEWRKYLREKLSEPGEFIFRVKMPDGLWYGEAYRVSRNLYDYYLPDNRKDEMPIRDKVFTEVE